MKKLLLMVLGILIASSAGAETGYTGTVKDVEMTLVSVEKKGYLELTFRGVNKSDEDQELFIYSYGCKIFGGNGKEYKYDSHQARKTFPPGVPLLYTVTFQSSAKAIKRIAYLKLAFRYSKETLVLRNIPVPYSQSEDKTAASWDKPLKPADKSTKGQYGFTAADVEFTLTRVGPMSGFLVFSFKGINKGDEEKKAGLMRVTLIGDNGKEYNYPRNIFPASGTFPPGVPVVYTFPVDKRALRVKKIAYLKFRIFGEDVVLKNIPNPYKLK